MKRRSASVSGAYQYDTGQRLRLLGLPSPEELAQEDDFLSGDVVTVQAQYSYSGDAQSEARAAVFDEENGIWMADVPDAYLTQHTPVTVHVYVSYGMDETHARAKTCYEATFTPISRPSPSSKVTPDQLNAWDILVQEVNLAIASTNEAASNANAKAVLASDAADTANDAASAANEQAQLWANAEVNAETLDPDAEATVRMVDADGKRRLIYGIPRGKNGADGKDGEPGKDGADGKAGEPGKDGTDGDQGPRGEPGATWTQLWSNAAAYSEMNAQELPVDLTGYDLCVVQFQYSTTDYILATASGPVAQGRSIRLMTVSGKSTSGLAQDRDLYMDLTNGKISVSNGSRNGNTNNTVCIPNAIYGVMIYKEEARES